MRNRRHDRMGAPKSARFFHALLLAPLAIVGCSSSPSSPSAPPSDAFPPSDSASLAESGTSSAETATTEDAAPVDLTSEFCTGTLKVDETLWEAIEAGVWSKTTRIAPAGATILVGFEYGKWTGYLIEPDGAAMSTDPSVSLVLDTDFTSTCAASSSNAAFTLLTRTVLHEHSDLTGAVCVLEAGTQFLHNRSFGGGAVGALAADELPAKCGFAEGYTTSLSEGNLIHL